MARLARAASLLVTAGLVVALGACAADNTPPSTPNGSAGPSVSASPGPTLPPVGADCRTQAERGRTLRLTNSTGLSLAAVDFGSGTAGVVLAHQSDGSLC